MRSRDEHRHQPMRLAHWHTGTLAGWHPSSFLISLLVLIVLPSFITYPPQNKYPPWPPPPSPTTPRTSSPPPTSVSTVRNSPPSTSVLTLQRSPGRSNTSFSSAVSSSMSWLSVRIHASPRAPKQIQDARICAQHVWNGNDGCRGGVQRMRKTPTARADTAVALTLFRPDRSRQVHPR